ncbi:LD-carboxypeptidase [Ferruginibacter sp. HRS2-29]|uniref:S66 peptidase family protein n=1 Tax=Ferruginibacter sp. HRS2-29 TaxID=2487334 RepID=UPI0020CBCDEE|nr:LD-carboxypeptidase [Ferruginibacter sp. HRS2-29]MCP9751779.1 LD-carboxypeptidase [Ferruginibacter sp. HRS2-29]
MKRKNFLTSILPAAISFNAVAKSMDEGLLKPFRIPPALQPGDIIAITSPAGYITPEDIQPAIKKMEEWGYRIRIGSTIGKRDYTFGGTDAERLADFQQLLNDDSVKAIMCARGGYGAVRIIDGIDFSRFVKKPKWIIGFSDITVLHAHINSNFNIATIHSKMCNSFPSDWLLAEPVQKETIESIRKCLADEKMQYHALPNAANRHGNTRGILVGGNLKTIESLAGSKSDLITKDKILFVEDTGEYLYSIDRMFWNLKRSGKLSQLKGLIVGGFKIKKDDAGDEFGQTLERIVLDKISGYNYPVCFDFPVGHQKNNFALKCGVKHTMDVNADGCTLTITN